MHRDAVDDHDVARAQVPAGLQRGIRPAAADGPGTITSISARLQLRDPQLRGGAHPGQHGAIARRENRRHPLALAGQVGVAVGVDAAVLAPQAPVPHPPRDRRRGSARVATP